MKQIRLLFLLLLAACAGDAPQPESAGITIVCTTNIVADAVTNLAPAEFTVTALMGPGVDPHLYKATQGDLSRLQQADFVVYNGLHLEGKMAEVLKKLGRIKPVYAMGEGLPEEQLINLQGQADSFDPHIWFDLSLWNQAVRKLANQLIKLYPEQAEEIEANYADYANQLLAEHERAKQKIASIPESNRVLVTAHDAFSYFGRAYSIQVLGLQGISTASEYGLGDVSNLVNTITENKIPAVFIESSVPKRSIEAVIEGCQKRGHQVQLGGELYSDALGQKSTTQATLIGAFQWNVTTIYSALHNEP